MDNQNNKQINVGARIKLRRKLVGMTLEELAQKTGLTASFLSQVERGKASLSLNSLGLLAYALKTPMFYFVTEENAAVLPPAEKTAVNVETPSPSNEKFNPIVAADGRARLVFPDTGIELELLVPNIGKKLLSFKGRLAPGKVSIANRLNEPTEEIIYVVSGELTLEFVDATYILHPDETIYFEGENLRRMINNSKDQETAWICTITPGIF